MNNFNNPYLNNPLKIVYMTRTIWVTCKTSYRNPQRIGLYLCKTWQRKKKPKSSKLNVKKPDNVIQFGLVSVPPLPLSRKNGEKFKNHKLNLKTILQAIPAFLIINTKKLEGWQLMNMIKISI